MPNWTDILKQADQFADDAEVALGDQKLKLGDLRQLLKAQTASVTTKEAELLAKEKDVSTREEQVAQLFADVQVLSKTALQSKGVNAEGANAALQSNGTFDYEHDVLLGPIWKEAQTAKQAAEEARKTLAENQRAAVTQIAALYNDIWGGEFARRGWDSTKLEAAKKHALENRIFNRQGVIDPIRAFDEMTRDERVAAQVAKAKKEGDAEGAERTRAELGASMLPFGASIQPKAPAGKVDAKLSMEENIRRNLREVLGKQGLAAGNA